MTEKLTIVQALAAVMSDVQAVRKSDRNAQQNYNFRGIDAVVNAVGPVLRKHGVICLPLKTDAHYRDVLTNTGKPSRECTVKVTYRFHGPAGDYLDAEVPGESMDFGDKGAPKAMSVAYRIALLQALCIPTDEVEPDAQSYEREQSHPAPPQRVTDAAWLEDIRKRLVACLTPGEVNGLEIEARQVWADNRLSDEDARTLRKEMAERMREIKGEPVGVGA